MPLRILMPLLILLSAGAAAAAEPPRAGLDARFADTIKPFLASHCAGCHTGSSAAAQLDLSRYDGIASIAADYQHWGRVRAKLAAHEMPPSRSPQPPDALRRRVIEWVDAVLAAEARRHAGDPGVVLARRLSNAEYNNTIRDLTGVDIRPAREFPVDPSNMAGFDNSGESLSMSPAMVAKYLQAAREVADHLVLKHNGIAFAPHLALVETDRDKYCINQIIDFYKRHNTDYSDYFVAAWRFRHRAALGQKQATLADIARQSRVSPTYLATVLETLESHDAIGPLVKLQAMWRGMPPARGAASEAAARAEADRMRTYVTTLRQKIAMRVHMIERAGIRDGVEIGQPFLMWRNWQYARNRRNFDREVLQVEGEERAYGQRMQMILPVAARESPTMIPRPIAPDPDLHVPAGERARYEAAFARFASVFPDTFYVSERGRYYPFNNRDSDKGRHLSAGFHNNMGYFRDDQPLYELVLDEAERRELDNYWRDLDFVAGALHRTYTQFYLAGESGAARADAEGGLSSVDVQAIFDEDDIMATRDLYLRRVRPSGNAAAIAAVEEHFAWVNENIRWLEKARTESEAIHLNEILAFAQRAYRRPLTAAEREALLDFYRSSRREAGLSHEEAMRDMVVRVLMSPHFTYRIDLADER